MCSIIGKLNLLLCVIIICQTTSGAAAASDVNSTTSVATPLRLPVGIFYETLCVDSMYFIRRQLRYALEDNDWWSVIDLKMIPFGKASFYNNTELGIMQVFCQHGNNECELNALHACIIETLNIRTAFQLINCMLRSYSNRIDECSGELKLDVTAAKECKRTRSTVDILKSYGSETEPLQLSFVPSIGFNQEFDPYEQNNIRYNFDTHFCRKYLEKFNITLPTCVQS